MKITMSGAIVHLAGDWTLTGVTQHIIDSMIVSLEQLSSGCEKNPRINCEHISEADAGGLQLLNVWLQCLRFRGVEPQLVNLPGIMHKHFNL